LLFVGGRVIFFFLAGERKKGVARWEADPLATKVFAVVGFVVISAEGGEDSLGTQAKGFYHRLRLVAFAQTKPGTELIG